MKIPEKHNEPLAGKVEIHRMARKEGWILLLPSLIGFLGFGNDISIICLGTLSFETEQKKHRPCGRCPGFIITKNALPIHRSLHTDHIGLAREFARGPTGCMLKHERSPDSTRLDDRRGESQERTLRLVDDGTTAGTTHLPMLLALCTAAAHGAHARRDLGAFQVGTTSGVLLGLLALLQEQIDRHRARDDPLAGDRLTLYKPAGKLCHIRGVLLCEGGDCQRKSQEC